MRLIDADELMAKVNSIRYMRKIKMQSLIDECKTVELIRCKDCKFATCIEQKEDWWECKHDKRVNHSDGFCNWAERKEE